MGPKLADGKPTRPCECPARYPKWVSRDDTNLCMTRPKKGAATRPGETFPWPNRDPSAAPDLGGPSDWRSRLLARALEPLRDSRDRLPLRARKLDHLRPGALQLDPVIVALGVVRESRDRVGETPLAEVAALD